MNEREELPRISATMATHTLAKIVDEARMYGKSVIIQRYGRDSAVVVPIETLKKIKPKNGKKSA